VYTHVSMTEELDIGEETVDSPPDLVRQFSETYQDLAKSSTEHLPLSPPFVTRRQHICEALEAGE
jgi:hypothetical protein